MKLKVVISVSLLIIVLAAAVTLFTLKERQSITITNQDTSTRVSEGGTISLGDTTQSSQPDAANSLPTPDQFMQYEDHKEKQTMSYIDIEAGNGDEAKTGSTVAVAYKGWLTNGTSFDQSPAGRPFSFTLGERRVIAGWEQGILGMKVGGKRRLIIPPALGYGSGGVGPIPGNAVLIFDVELESM